MAPRIDTKPMPFTYQLMDIREIEAESLMRSGRPADYVVARDRVFTQLLIVAGLRTLPRLIQAEAKRTGIVIVETKNPALMEWHDKALREGMPKGRAEGVTELLHAQVQLNFGPLPQWVEVRLSNATPVQLPRWSRKLMTAQTLEDVLSKSKSSFVS